MNCSVNYFTAEDGSTRWRCPRTFGTKESHSIAVNRCWRSNCPGAKSLNPTAFCQKPGCTNLRRSNRDAKFCSDNCRKQAHRMRKRGVTL
jgi:hypothetical protein